MHIRNTVLHILTENAHETASRIKHYDVALMWLAPTDALPIKNCKCSRSFSFAQYGVTRMATVRLFICIDTFKLVDILFYASREWHKVNECQWTIPVSSMLGGNKLTAKFGQLSIMAMYHFIQLKLAFFEMPSQVLEIPVPYLDSAHTQ